MGGRTLEAMALIGIGLDRFSITPVAVGSIKAMIRSLDRSAVIPAVEAMLAEPVATIRPALTRWAEEQGVVLG
jgi:phosphotransferase system enzyme I (PtsP)